jgi:hypothetical protein
VVSERQFVSRDGNGGVVDDGATTTAPAAGVTIIHVRAPLVWQTIESTLSVFFAFVVGLVVVIAGLAVLYAARSDPNVRWLAAASVPVMGAECAFLAWLKWSLERGGLRPFIPRFALRQAAWPFPVRPLAACWWLAHFALAAYVIYLLERSIGSQQLDGVKDLGGLLLLAAVAWIVTHCGLMYLLLAVTALHRSEYLVMILWRGRFLIDVIVAGGMIVGARFIGLD